MSLRLLEAFLWRKRKGCCIHPQYKQSLFLELDETKLQVWSCSFMSTLVKAPAFVSASVGVALEAQESPRDGHDLASLCPSHVFATLKLPWFLEQPSDIHVHEDSDSSHSGNWVSIIPAFSGSQDGALGLSSWLCQIHYTLMKVCRFTGIMELSHS